MSIVEQLKSELHELNETVQQKDHEIERLQWLVKKYKHQIYGSPSEKFIDTSEQFLFNEIEAEIPNIEPEQTELIDGYTRKAQGRGRREPFPEALPREEVVIDLPEDEKICPHDGTELEYIGDEVTEKLKTVPAQVSVVVEKRKKYACPCCQNHMAQAKSNSVLPKTIATPELLSFIIFSKFYQGLPFYRIEEFFKLQNVELSRTLMASWLIRLSEKLQPIVNILEEWAHNTGYVAIDATSVQVLKEKGREPKTKSFMWVRGSPELGIALFDYNVSGGGKVADQLMTGFAGALQADAHKGYELLDEKVTRLGCMMHARRRFYNAWVRGGKKDGLAAIGLKMIKKLYKFEEGYKTQNLTHLQRYEARLKEAGPYMLKITSWCQKKRSKVPKSSELGNAIHYFINEYNELSGFLKDGRYEIDNGWVERVIRKFAIGRNNWMFSDTTDGAHASALFYSLVITAKQNDKDPFEVMTGVLKQLPEAESIDDFERLASLFVKRSTAVV